MQVVVSIFSVHDSGLESVNIPPPSSVERFIERLVQDIPPPKKKVEKRLRLVFKDVVVGASDTYILPYPANLYWARRIKKWFKRHFAWVCEDWDVSIRA